MMKEIERCMGNGGKGSQLSAKDKSSLRALDRELPPMELKPETVGSAGCSCGEDLVKWGCHTNHHLTIAA